MTFCIHTHTFAFDTVYTLCVRNRNRRAQSTEREWRKNTHCIKVRLWATNWNAYSYASQSSSFSLSLSLGALKVQRPPARWQWKCAWRKIGSTYLWMFLRFLLFRFPALLISLVDCRAQKNVTWIRGMFGIGWTHKLSFIMLCNFSFNITFCRWPMCNSLATMNHSFGLRPLSGFLLFHVFLQHLLIEVFFKLYVHLDFVVNR